ncbi:MAG TPA: hypothetical protein VLM89_15490 [Phycisphaerae bacterium]|nr:hypothetical protein [Phycisphaerae bacterium]
MAHLRLKRLFLLSLVISLSACAIVAIGVLLFSSFNKTTGRILGTLLSLGFHSAMAMACAYSLEKQRRPVLSMAGLILFAANFALMMVCVWWPEVFKPYYRWNEDCMVRSIATTGILTGSYLLSIPCWDLAHAKRWQPLPQVGAGLCVLTVLMLLMWAWAVRIESELFRDLTGVAVTLAFSCAHQCLLGRVRWVAGLWALAWLAYASLWMLAAVVSISILAETRINEFTMRVIGATGVLDAVSTIALVIMTKVKGVEKIQSLESTPARINIQCPRCSMQQVLDAGASKCAACGLRFRIEVEEPRCAKCGYLLWQLPGRRCPECGTAF